MTDNKNTLRICPVCGQGYFPKRDSHEICPVCGWIDDQFQTEHIFVGHGANTLSLAQQRKAYRILNGKFEVGYGNDNLLWGAGLDKCKLCNQRICVDECMRNIKLLMEDKLPDGVIDITTAKKDCAHCIMGEKANLENMRRCTKMVDKPNSEDTYGSGDWGAGYDEYKVKKYRKRLESLIEYCHSEAERNAKEETAQPADPDFDANKEMLMQMALADEEGRRNFQSWFSRPLLSIADFIGYAIQDNGVLDHRFSLWAFGSGDAEDKFEFKKKEKKKADKVLHITLSFFNYKCNQFAMPGLYYMDNVYKGWDPVDFDDTIAAWFVDIGDELDEANLKDFIKETLEESFAYSHVKLALHMLAHLEYAKDDVELQQLVALFSKVPEMHEIAERCRQ